MVNIDVIDDVRNDEFALTHELIHAKKFMQMIPGNKHNEKQIEFETLGRVSKEGIKQNEHGYYFHSVGLKGRENIKGDVSKRDAYSRKKMIQDRKLLTGSLNKSIIGKVAERKAEELYKKSVFRERR